MLSARNRIKGKIMDYNIKENIGEVKVKLYKPFTIKCIITKEAAEELNFKIGDKITAIIKATEIMIEK
ncbi:MAG: TOBE domain-containing protein [Candidatus Odinarchaeia archaeon]